MVRLVRGPHLGGKYVDAGRMPGSSPKAEGVMAHSPSMGPRPAVRETSQSLCLKISAAENARLRRENQELRETNELLKAASAFFASELDPKR